MGQIIMGDKQDLSLPSITLWKQAKQQLVHYILLIKASLSNQQNAFC